jgi:uncharacterized protein
MEAFFKKFEWIGHLIGALLLVALIFGAIKVVAAIKQIGTIGEGIQAQNTITVAGSGFVYASPDIATISFDITDEESSVSAAETKVASEASAALAYLNQQAVAKKDIQTSNFSIYPRYEYNTAAYLPNNGTRTLAGYDVTESFDVTVRDLTKAGDILGGLAKLNVTNVNGPSFTIEDPDAVQATARAKAIDDAKAKAEVLAAQLGVSLGKVVSFNDNGASPVIYAKTMMAPMAAGVDSSASVPVETGQNKITSDVTIVYELR